jgi:hypothetical protein
VSWFTEIFKGGIMKMRLLAFMALTVLNAHLALAGLETVPRTNANLKVKISMTAPYLETSYLEVYDQTQETLVTYLFKNKASADSCKNSMGSWSNEIIGIGNVKWYNRQKRILPTEIENQVRFKLLEFNYKVEADGKKYIYIPAGEEKACRTHWIKVNKT